LIPFDYDNSGTNSREGLIQLYALQRRRGPTTASRSRSKNRWVLQDTTTIKLPIDSSPPQLADWIIAMNNRPILDAERREQISTCECEVRRALHQN